MRILIFVGYYLPGYKSGGPLRTIVNLVQHLGSQFDFWIVTRDRDLGDMVAYDQVKIDEWQLVDGAHVFYVSPKNISVSNLSKLISATPHDVLYLNSFFDLGLTIKPLLARYIFNATKAPVIVAPRGEFSIGALKLKSFKKRIYIAAAKLFGLYKDVCYQASSVYEAGDISAALGVSSNQIRIAIDLPEKATSGSTLEPTRARVNGVHESLRIIFLSRISPMKNLDYALSVLRGVSSSVQFDIYGPKEDANYWALCEHLMLSMPDNVVVNYCGSLNPADVKGVFAQYDLFFFPTRGENYGHVIAESLSVGTPVLISDQTPWRRLESIGIGWDMPLNAPNLFVNIIDQFAALLPDVREQQRLMVKDKSCQFLLDPAVLEANKELFKSQIAGRIGR